MAIIVRYGEIGLKGENRYFFEKKLVENLKECLRRNSIKFEKVLRLRGRILIECHSKCECLKNVFGIVSFSSCIEEPLDVEKIKKAALGLYTQGSFKISTKRVEKVFMDSHRLNEIVGEHIVNKKKAPVDLEKPDVEIGIELFNGKAYLFNEKVKGAGGLPIGTEGKVAVLMEKNYEKAALLMMKRGCKVIFVGKGKVNEEISKYSYGMAVKSEKRVPKEALAVVVPDTLETLKERKKIKKEILRPLIIS